MTSQQSCCRHEWKACEYTGFSFCKKCGSWQTMIELGKTPIEFRDVILRVTRH